MVFTNVFNRVRTDSILYPYYSCQIKFVHTKMFTTRTMSSTGHTTPEKYQVYSSPVQLLSYPHPLPPDDEAVTTKLLGRRRWTPHRIHQQSTRQLEAQMRNSVGDGFSRPGAQQRGASAGCGAGYAWGASKNGHRCRGRVSWHQRWGKRWGACTSHEVGFEERGVVVSDPWASCMADAFLIFVLIKFF